MPSGLPRTPWTNAGRELDQALVQRALGEIVGAHPGRLEQLVRLEEVAPLVGRGRLVEGAAARRAPGAAGTPSPGRPGGWSGGDPTAVGGRGGSGRRRGADGSPGSVTSGRPAPAGRRTRRSSSCHHSTSPSPRRQHSQIWRPLASAGKSIRPVSISRRVMPSSSIRATPACIWSMTPCIRSRRTRTSASIFASVVASPPTLAAALVLGRMGEHRVAEPDQLRALVAQRLEDRPDLGIAAFASSRS